MTTYTRPNGKPYQPRNPDQRLLIPWGDPTGTTNPHGCAIIGTHDIDDAQPRANAFLQWITGDPATRATNPVIGWWRTSYRRSEPILLEDDIKGRPGIMFTCQEE